MVWPYGLSSPVLTNHAKTSERTEVATVPNYAPTVSTNSTVHASTTHSLPLNLNVSPSQPGPISNSGTTEASRVYGFDLNENWQGDREQLPQSDHHSKARH